MRLLNSEPRDDERATLRVRLFGPPSVEWDEEPVAVFVRPLCAVLLAMIVLTEPGHRLSRKGVAADLWPDDAESVAAANLRRHLSFLVAALPAANECIGRDRETLWWQSPSAPWCDVVEFERGELECYQGDFMTGFAHEWVVLQRTRLRGAAVARWLGRAEMLRENDDGAGALASVRRAADIDPIDESLAQFEIELHAERGDTAAADAAYAALKLRLHDIDAEPSAGTVALIERVHRLARDATVRLPRPLTLFVENEALADVAALVPSHRLVTIVGPGGVGKTRLALEVAHRVASRFVDGAYFADLSTVAEGDALSDALSRALGASTELASKGFSGIQTFLRNRRALLLLDNCEQIVESCSWFLSQALESAPYLHVIATTREAFGLRSERCYPLQPLSPADAERLFVERARSVAWSANGIPAETGRIAAICKRLDRLPLALELSAGLLGTLSLADVELALDEGLDRMRSRDPTTPARHRSLLDVIAWSVSLLDDRERGAFSRLAVFAGSFSAEAARAVCAIDVATLGELVAKSVLVREDAIEGRFAFLNNVGEYARRQFEADPDAGSIRNAHAAWYAGIAVRSRQPSFWNTEREWLLAIDRDFPNVAQALHWSLFGAGRPESGFVLAMGLNHYFRTRGFHADGISWTRAAIERAEPGSADHARLKLCLSSLEMWRGRFADAIEHATTGRKGLSALGIDREIPKALNDESAILLYLGRAEEAKALLDRALPLAQAAGDIRSEALIYSNLAFLSSSRNAGARGSYVLALRRFEEIGDRGLAAHMLNCIAACDFNDARYDAAAENLRRALAVQRDIGHIEHVATILSDLGDVAVMQGASDDAHALYGEALAIYEAHDVELSYDGVLSGCAALAVKSGRARDAARLLGAARARETARTPARLRVFDHAYHLAEQTLGAEEYAHEMRFGQELSRKEVAKLARSIVNHPAHV